ncbi:lactocepin [Thermoflexales bacterium]|nr:lactocepin [Thermoflexales bacterium]
MFRNKQVMLNIMVVLALVLGLGVFPVGATIPAGESVTAAGAINQTTKSDTPVVAKIKDQKPDLQVMDISEVEVSSEPAIYMIRLMDPPLAAYAGGIQELRATSPQVTGERKLNVNSPAARAYTNYLAGKRVQAIASVEKALNRSIEVVYQYYATNNGFAAYLTPAEAAVVAELPSVVFIQRDYEQELQTDVGPVWIGAQGIWDGTATGVATKGEGVIVGIIDTGINSDNPSFADIGGDGYNHTNPWGAGTYVGYCVANPGFCNDKLIGAWNYPVLSSTPEDADGHGSHTASTTAGNVVTATVVSGSGAVFTRTISGVAPHANIVAYAACCASSALAAAIDQTVIDGVDVINYSIGSPSPTPDAWTDFDSVGFLNARNAGIFVANSAGNSGPGADTVGSPADVPWLTSVAATTHNRAFLSSVISATGGITPLATLAGRGMSNGLGSSPVVYAGAAPYNDPLCENATPDGAFTGMIVVCDRGVIGRVQKGINVQARGAVGMIMVEVQVGGGPGGLATDSEQPIPAVYLTTTDGNTLKAWLAAGTGHQVAISPTVMDVDTSYADVLASFSSRGQNRSLPDIIAPHVAAPGVAIFAAYRTPEEFAVIQGTSMASPHVAGAGALLTALHPTWTPAEIQSALMTTAATSVVKDNGVTPADPFDVGAGRVDLNVASRAGFVLNETHANYVAANPATGGDVKKLNLASFGNGSCVQKCSWQRTLTSVVTATVNYTASVIASAGMTVTVTPATFTLGAGASRMITVSVDTSGLALGTWNFAQVNLDGGSTVPVAHFPVAVRPAASSLPEEVEITTPRDSGSQDFSLISQDVTTLTHSIAGLIPAIRSTDVLTGDSNVGSGGLASALDNPNDGVRIITVTLTTNDVRLHGGIIESTSSDMDLFLVKDTNGNGFPNMSDLLVDQSATGAVLEHVDVVTNTGGTYFFVIQNFDPGPNPPSPYTFEIAQVAKADAGNVTLLGPTAVAGGTPYTLTVVYNEPLMDAGENWYGVATLGTDPGNPGNIGQVPITVHRVADEVSKTASTSTAQPGDVVTYTLVIKNPDTIAHNYILTDVLPSGLTYIPGSLTGPATFDSGLNAVLISMTVSGTIKAPNYIVADSLTNPAVAAESPLGGFVNLGAPSPRGDNLAFAFNDVGCPTLLTFYDDPAVSGTNAGALGYSTNGGVFPRSSSTSAVLSAGALTAPIPTAALPNGFITGFGGDLSITNTVNITDAGRVAGSLGTCGTNYLFAIQMNLHKKSDDAQKLKAQYLYDQSMPDVHWIAFGDVSPTFSQSGGVSGAENFAGTLGVNYTGPITSGLVLKYSRALVAAPPITVTFRVTIENTAPAVVVNSANYTVDVPHTTLMTSEASFTVPVIQPEVVTVMATPSNPLVGNLATITATVTNLMSVPMAGVPVTFTTGLYYAHLSGLNETPPVTTTSGTGHLDFTYDPATNQLAYDGNVSGLSGAISAAHIHRGAAGVPGPVAVALSYSGTVFSGVVTLSPSDEALLLSGGLYVNVHTAANPGGEIRGQILDHNLTSILSGANEVPPVASSGTGALNFMFDPATNRLTYHGSVSGLNSNVTAAHIHTGTAGVNGGVLYNLSYITTTNGATFSGVLTVTQAHVNALLSSGLYANVHTTSSPGGEVRGQINVGWLGVTDSQGQAVTHFTTDTPGPVTFYAFAGEVYGSALVVFRDFKVYLPIIAR